MKLIDWILRVYPPAWRERYEEEMRVVLEQHGFTFLTACDLLVGALDARFDPYYRREGVLFSHTVIRVSTIMFLYMLAITFTWFNLWEVALIATSATPHPLISRTVDSFLSLMVVLESRYLLQTCLEMITILVFFIYVRRMIRRWGWRKALFAAACFLLPTLAIAFVATIPFGFQQGLETIQFMTVIAVTMGELLGNVVVAFVKLRSLRAERKAGHFRFLLGTEIVFVMMPVLMTVYYHNALPTSYIGSVLLTMLTPFNSLATLCFFVVTERWSRRATTFVCAYVGLFAITVLVLATIARAQALNFMQQIGNYAEMTVVLTIIAILAGAAVLMMFQSLQRRWKTSLVGHVKEYEEPLPSMDMSGRGEGDYR